MAIDAWSFNAWTSNSASGWNTCLGKPKISQQTSNQGNVKKDLGSTPYVKEKADIIDGSWTGNLNNYPFNNR